MARDDKNRRATLRGVTFEIAQKAVDLALRRCRQIRRIESEVGTVFHIDDDFAFEAKVGDRAKRFFRLRIDLTQSSLELAELTLDAFDAPALDSRYPLPPFPGDLPTETLYPPAGPSVP